MGKCIPEEWLQLDTSRGDGICCAGNLESLTTLAVGVQ